MTREPYPTDFPTVVTCGLPYANGDLHIGHLRSLVSADVLTRALNVIGEDAIYVCGSDMHGTPVAVNAWQEGVDPEEFALEWHERYLDTFPKFNIDHDNYGHTHDATNTETTLEIVETLIEEGHIYEREIEVAWDPEEDQPLPDRYVEGTCPYCGERARGDECDEGCGRHLEPGEIEDPVSTITGNPAEYRTRPHKFFRVSEFEALLEDFLDALEGTDNARNQPRQWIEEGLQDWCITRDMEWGIPYPDEEELVLYVWVDAPIEYVSSTKQYAERTPDYDWTESWKGDGQVIHVIGRDIIQHHTIFWPAMLDAAGYNMPRAVCAHGFITIDGKGLSTSRNRAIWAREYLEAGFEADPLRFYLTTTSGLQQDIDFSWRKFADRVNGELVGTLGNFLYRSLLFAHREFDGTPDAEPTDEVIARIEDAIEAYCAAVNDYDIRGAGMTALELAQFGNEYIQRHEPWRLVEEDEAEAATVIRDCVQIAKAIAILASPTMPETMEKLWWELGESVDLDEVTVEECLAAPPESFGSPTELFAQIEDERVEGLSAELAERAGDDSAEDDEEEPAATDERIAFEDFQALDIRVGRIETAEPIESADELMRLEVDIGSETRQIVAGIQQMYDVDELVGQRVIVLANLESTTLFGVESDGMVLAAGEDADLLTTIGDADPGEPVM